MKVELLLIIDKESKYLVKKTEVNSLIKTISLVSYNIKTKCVKYKDTKANLNITKIKNAYAIVYNLIFEVQDDNNIKIEEFEEFVTVVCELFENQPGVTRLETIWDDVKGFYAKKAYPEILNIENKMRMLISKFMYFQENYNWTKKMMDNNVVKTIRKENEGISLLYAIDFIDLADVLFKEYPTSSLQQLKKLIKESKNSVPVSKLEDFIPKNNWDRYFRNYAQNNNIKELWDEIYSYRCSVAHSRGLSSNEYKRLMSKINMVDNEIENLLGHISDIKVSNSLLEFRDEEIKVEYISEETYKSICNQYTYSRAFIDEDYMELYDNINKARDYFLDKDFITTGLALFRNVMSSPRFEVFKEISLGNKMYAHFGGFQIDRIISGGKSELLMTFHCSGGMIFSPKTTDVTLEEFVNSIINLLEQVE